MPERQKTRAYSYVRMSTDLQLKGDSLRRQLQQSREYASRQGWELAEVNELNDIGMSAYSGANLSDGALGRFLSAIRERKIEAGSFLIVESLDRLSRQDVVKSLGLFTEILNAGVHIVTLTDGKTYTAGSDFADLIVSIAIMSRAYDESRTKSCRISVAWANKRKNSTARKLTAKCPGWLKLSPDRRSFDVISFRRRVVTRIFDDSAAGIGNYSIAKRLNASKIPPFGRARGWHTSSVAKILSNRAVIGEFQPHRLLNGRRVPEGDPINDYFPQIISEQLYYRAQNARNQRRLSGGGRKGAKISNLLSGLARCAYCKGPMRFENKGPGPKGGRYLVCDGARRGLGCEKTAWRYDDLEASFLAFVKELDLESLMRNASQTERRVALDRQIEALRGKVASIEEKKERTVELFHQSGAAAHFVGRKLGELQEHHQLLLEEITAKERERAQLRSELSGLLESKDQIKELLARLQRSAADEVYKLRAQIAARLKSLVSAILIAPVGWVPARRKVLAFLDGQESCDTTRQLIDSFRNMLTHEHKHRQFFLVTFRDGSSRGVYPKRDDPFEFEEQIVASDSEGVLNITANGEFRERLFKPRST